MKILSLNHCFTLPALLTSLGLLLGACGGTDTDPGTTTVEPKYTLDNVCEKTAPLVCAQRESCCTMTSAYEEAGCITNEMAECAKNVADVNAGIMTFDGDAVDACIAATDPFAQKCYLEVTDLYQLPVALEPCTRVWAGQLLDGATCERTAQCKSSLSDRELVQCDNSTKKCTTTKFLPEGSACKLAQDLKEFCDEGLYCDFDFLSMKGTCKVQTPLGDPCTPGPLSTECGLGNVCDSMSLKCVEGKAEGEACTTPLDCKTVTCKNSVCSKPDPLYNKQQCTGTP